MENNSYVSKIQKMWKSECFRKHVFRKCKERRIKILDMKISELQTVKKEIEDSEDKALPVNIGKKIKNLQSFLDIDEDFAVLIVESYDGRYNLNQIDVQKSQRWGLKFIDALIG